METDAVQVPIDVKVLVVHPHRMVGVERLSASFSGTAAWP